MTDLPPGATPHPDPDNQDGEPVYSEAEWQSLVDYLCGEGSPDTRAAIERRLADDPRFAAFAAPIVLAWQTPVQQPAWDWASNWAVIQHKADTTQGSLQASRRSQRSGIVRWGLSFMRSPALWRPMQWATLAALLIATLAIKNIVRAYLWPNYQYQGGPAGTTIVLPDSSVAVLAPGSYLGTERGFPRTTRTVYLFGDARFTIVHSARIPFIVQVPGASARVLGTAFRMQVDTTPHVRVDVTQGTVAIETCDSAGRWHQVHVLTAGQAVHVPMLAIWMAQAGYTIAATGMPISEAAHVEGALRRAAIRLGAAAAAHTVEDSAKR